MTLLAVIDPAWNADQGGGGKGANAKYQLSGVDAIAQAYRLSEPWTDTGDALVFMWATTGAVCAGDAHALANLLRLEIVASYVWCKVEPLTDDDLVNLAMSTMPTAPLQTSTEAIAERARRALADVVDSTRLACIAILRGAERIGLRLFKPQSPGMGQWSRCEHEYLFVCRRGNVQTPDTKSRPRSTIYAPKREHSAKPDEAWQVIETIAASSMRGVDAVVAVEWNARVQRHGWGAVGRLDGEDGPIVNRPAVGDWRC